MRGLKEKRERERETERHSPMSSAASLCLSLSLASGAGALELGRWFRPPRPVARADAKKLEADLLAIARTGSSNLYPAFCQLEQACPPPADLLLSSPELLDGRWSLLATVAARVGEDVTQSSAQAGVVNASGISVDVSQDALPVQEVDVASGRIGNEVTISLLGQRVILRVSGGFKPAEPPAPGTRAIVTFDSLDIFTKDGKRLLSAGWIFDLARRINPGLQNGADESSWLETTYISENARLGRGNKGSVFVLERVSQNSEAVLADWPL